MSYQKNLALTLKQHIAGSQVMEHGRAILVNIPSESQLKAVWSTLPDMLSGLKSQVEGSTEWVKIILYNNRSWFQCILNADK